MFMYMYIYMYISYIYIYVYVCIYIYIYRVNPDLFLFLQTEREMVRLLALLAFRRPACQALVAELGGMAVVLQRCQVHTHTHTHTHICIYVYIYIYICILLYIHIYMYVWIPEGGRLQGSGAGARWDGCGAITLPGTYIYIRRCQYNFIRNYPLVIVGRSVTLPAPPHVLLTKNNPPRAKSVKTSLIRIIQT